MDRYLSPGNGPQHEERFITKVTRAALTFQVSRMKIGHSDVANGDGDFFGGVCDVNSRQRLSNITGFCFRFF